MDLQDLPPIGEDLARLACYQHNRAAEEERRLVAEVKFKRDLGEPLTNRDQRVLAYSKFGNAPACHHL